MSRAFIFMYGRCEITIEQINNTTGTVTYLHHDQAGSTRLLTGSTGKVEGSYTYGPYGETTGHTGTATTPLGYDAQYTSTDTGLIYLRARVYDPATAQFLSVDPALPITRAPYTYANDDPLSFRDPTGLWSPVETLEGVSDEVGHVIALGSETVIHGALDVVAVVPYSVYYGSYELAHGINGLGEDYGLPGEVVSHLASLPLAALQGLGLAGDAAIDELKHIILGDESICDEGVRGYINPLHSFLPSSLRGPEVYLPGIHSNGSVDFEW
jgi:RHS repeat-associated protein